MTVVVRTAFHVRHIMYYYYDISKWSCAVSLTTAMTYKKQSMCRDAYARIITIYVYIYIYMRSTARYVRMVYDIEGTLPYRCVYIRELFEWEAI